MAALLALAGPLLAAEKRIYMIGNSMTDGVGYSGFQALATSAGHTHIWGRQTRSGWNIAYAWYDGATVGSISGSSNFGRWNTALANHQWDAITLQPTDRLLQVAFAGREEGDRAMIMNFMNVAFQKSPDAQFFIYSRPPRRPTVAGVPQPIDFPSAWNKTYDANRENWDLIDGRGYMNAVLATIRANQPAGTRPVQLIPMAEVMYRIDQRIRMGQPPPGLTDINQLYIDASHYNSVGSYVAALTFYTSIYRESPVGLGVPSNYGTISPALAADLQQIVYDTVLQTPFTSMNLIPEPATALAVLPIAALLVRRRRDVR
jgi:hypothetical protein